MSNSTVIRVSFVFLSASQSEGLLARCKRRSDNRPSFGRLQKNLARVDCSLDLHCTHAIVSKVCYFLLTRCSRRSDCRVDEAVWVSRRPILPELHNDSVHCDRKGLVATVTYQRLPVNSYSQKQLALTSSFQSFQVLSLSSGASATVELIRSATRNRLHYILDYCRIGNAERRPTSAKHYNDGIWQGKCAVLSKRSSAALRMLVDVNRRELV